MDYPNSDEEYELMYADELEAMHDMEMEDDCGPPSKPKSKRSLDFNSHLSPKQNGHNSTPVRHVEKESSSSSGLNGTAKVSPGCQPLESINKRHTPPDDDYPTENASNKRLRIDHDLFNGDEDPEIKQDILIDRIVHLRQQTSHFEGSLQDASTDELQRRFRSEYVTRKVPQWPFVSVEGVGGKRIYLRLHTEGFLAAQMENYEKDKIKNGNYLLSGNFSKILIEATKELEHLQKRKEENVNTETVSTNNEKISSNLWVSDHKPRSYVQLLSDESVNRTLLHWLKLWDRCVFGRNSRRRKAESSEEEVDTHGRPANHLVALLCGPPGLGKTTLAHLVATVAGYNVVEVNASDDRSAAIMRQRLESATQMQACMGGNANLPNCLILDEIDGAPQPTIDVLVKFIQGKEGKGKKGKSAKDPKDSFLKRPIICICNDAYVPALRPLRQIALVLHVPPTSSARLGERLVQVCRERGLKSDLGCMMALAEKTHNDIRAALSVLQTVAPVTRNSNISLSQIQKANVGVKDMQEGLFTIWQKVFQISKPKVNASIDSYSKNQNKIDSTPISSKSEGVLQQRMKTVLRAVHGCGDYDRLTIGVYENIPNMTSKPVSMGSMVKSLQWFVFNDLISSTIHSTQNYVLYPYLQYAFVVWHFIFASMSWPKLTYPSQGFEMNTKIKRVKEVVEYMLEGASPCVRSHCRPTPLALDILTYLLEIIAPSLKTTSRQLQSSKEKESLAQVVDIMIDYNLNYTQERTPDGVYQFNLDPNVESVCRLDGSGRSLPYAARQLVAHEIALEKMRRAEASLFRDGTPASVQKVVATEAAAPSAPQQASAVQEGSSPASKTVVSHLQKLTPKALKQKASEKITKDFFGRVITPSKVIAKAKEKEESIIKGDVWFHFKEGHNNAVRRTVYIKDLLADPNQPNVH